MQWLFGFFPTRSMLYANSFLGLIFNMKRILLRKILMIDTAKV